MSPRVRIVLGLASFALGACLMVADYGAQRTRRDAGSLASGLRKLSHMSAMMIAAPTVFGGLWHRRLCRQAGLSWWAHRYRRRNRFWSVAIPVLFSPLAVAIVLAPQLYWSAEQGWLSDLLAARVSVVALLVAWGIPLTGLSLYHVLVVEPWESDRAASRACGSCGYNLTGTTSDRCPECGHPITGPTAQEKQKTANT